MTPLQERFLETINHKLYYEGTSGKELAVACEVIANKFAESVLNEYRNRMKRQSLEIEGDILIRKHLRTIIDYQHDKILKEINKLPTP